MFVLFVVVFCVAAAVVSSQDSTFAAGRRRMRLPRDSVAAAVVASSPPIQQQQQTLPSSSSSSQSSPSVTTSSCKLLGNKENVQPAEVVSSADRESSTAANLLWLLDFRLDNLLPNDGNNSSDKMAKGQSVLLFIIT